MIERSVSFKKLAVLLLFFIAMVSFIIHYKIYNMANLKSYVLSFGNTAPVIFLVLCTVRPLILLPVGIFSALGGLLFGAFVGTLYTLIGSIIGSVIAYYLARFFGKDLVEKLLNGKYKRLGKKSREHGFYVTFMLRVVPILPFDAVSYICGLSDISMKDYLLGTILGIIPGTFIYSYFGSSLKNVMSKEFFIAILLLVCLALIPLLYKKISKNNLDDIDFENEDNSEIS
ncbi:TVP38/TMEM64 family inner membrane protein YdjZ [Caloramator mitchellensis]|uniref:TVP38/TMEM64 family membrane protein n=1 Tax=Caloramator mitchellensis TaxID=908809 RepID=A0A0R3K0M6_CALMK|nr:TVP38/TMEM64 family protein [Caloramator mitchellensis]KRQ86796.1 TVP38/TMEM64 family inner membrane protein YdjZ [Caloramator mitchellensis]